MLHGCRSLYVVTLYKGAITGARLCQISLFLIMCATPIHFYWSAVLALHMQTKCMAGKFNFEVIFK